jgi:hypothetical protein
LHPVTDEETALLDSNIIPRWTAFDERAPLSFLPRSDFFALCGCGWYMYFSAIFEVDFLQALGYLLELVESFRLIEDAGRYPNFGDEFVSNIGLRFFGRVFVYSTLFIYSYYHISWRLYQSTR